MRFFSSNVKNKIDAKGRVSIPAPFRKVFYREDDPTVILIPAMRDQPALDGMSMSQFERMVESLEQMAPLDEVTYALQTRLIAEARQLQIDDTGRIVLTQDLRDAAGLSGDTALFAGLGRTFQIWSPEVYEERLPALRALAAQNFNRLQWSGAPKPDAGAAGGGAA